MTTVDWKPIETAPRDGTHILIYIPQCEITWQSWMGESYYWDDPEFEPERGWWDVSTGCIGIEGEPSHWAPLPDPPEGA